MLAEFATHTFPPSACSAPMSGVTVWRFDGGLANAHLPLQLAPQHYEAFFCLDGTLTLRRTRQRTELVSAQDILLLSSVGSLQMVQASTGLRGLLVAVDGAGAGASLAALSALTGFGPLNTAAVGRRMQAHEGCAVIAASPWANVTCANLALLTPPEQSRYAVFKALELLYLLSAHDLIAETPAAAPGNSNSALTQIVQEVASYMRCHLDERLTIDGLSTRFGVSPTALKKEFRRLYGQPLHAWLQEQRLTQAARLLRESTMTVLEVAQEVGYSSTSQFSAAFVRRFGHTPGQYRRISV